MLLLDQTVEESLSSSTMELKTVLKGSTWRPSEKVVAEELSQVNVATNK